MGRDTWGSKQSTLTELWATYRERVMSVNAPPIQITECRRAFYAGAECMMKGLLLAVGDDSVPDETGMEYLSNRQEEIQQFVADVKAGRA